MKQTDLDPEDARAIGIAFMEALPEDACWYESPIEWVVNLQNALHDAREELKDLAFRPVFDGGHDHEDGEPRLTGWECLICGVVDPKLATFDHLDECALHSVLAQVRVEEPKA